MKTLIREVLDLQKAYSHENTEIMQRRGKIVRDMIPQWLETIKPKIVKEMGVSGSDLKFQGKDGIGRKTEVPWVRFFSESRSPSATEGWYCVLLFHAQGDGFCVSLGHGATRWENGGFQTRTDEELIGLVTWARNVLKGKTDSDTALLVGHSLGSRGRLGESYERGTALSRWFDLNSLPTENQITATLCEFAEYLGIIYDAGDLGRAPESSPPDLAAIQIALGESDGKKVNRLYAGQGYGLTYEERRAVEKRGMELAKGHLDALGFTVEDKSETHSYDYLATKGNESIFVEVKGTTCLPGKIILSKNEVELHKANYPKNALILVHSINLNRREKPPQAHGGEVVCYFPWKLVDGGLTPLAYQYSLNEE
jgi:hypothetical protein